jgi:hypothetical protein
MHSYIENFVVKTKDQHTLLNKFKEMFTNLRWFQMKLNPEKYVFGIPAGQLLGFLVSE